MYVVSKSLGFKEITTSILQQYARGLSEYILSNSIELQYRDLLIRRTKGSE